jgi:cardiolipin synthase
MSEDPRIAGHADCLAVAMADSDSSWLRWLQWPAWPDLPGGWAALAGAALAAAAILLIANLSHSEKRIVRRVKRRYGSDDPAFQRTLSVLFGPAVLAGNRVESFVNGRSIFPAMLEAIESAQASVDFETFIYWSGAVGDRFAQALIERARAGVAVHVLLDWVGSQPIAASLVARMEAGGVQVVRYHPPRWPHLTRLNNRTHRKLLVVDGRIGFTGGVGIADDWDGDADLPHRWRDTHYRVTGPAVAQMQAAFLDNWIKGRGELLHGERYFPALEPAGDSPAQVFLSSPSGGAESMHLMVNYALGCASRSIRIATAYFVPDEMTIGSLLEAARRGVPVTVLVPGRRTDSVIARRASQYMWGRLLAGGVRIHAYQPCQFHWKVLIVDDWWVSVGSTNFDSRSFSLNDEANLNVYDASFAQGQIALFDADLARSRPVTLEGWRRRSRGQRLYEAASYAIRSQL